MNALSQEEAAGLNDYDAVQAGLPRHVEATIIVNVEGRPESENFTVSLRFQPQAHARPWSSVTIDGYMLQVGGRSYRLNPYQLRAVQLVEILRQTDSLQGRLALWPQLVRLTHAPRWARLEVTGYIPNVTLFDAHEARITITNGRMLPVPLMALQRPLTHGCIMHQGRLISWEECYRQGYIPSVLQTKRHGYVRLSPELIEALTLLHQALGESDIKSATKAHQAAQLALPAGYRHLILPA